MNFFEESEQVHEIAYWYVEICSTVGELQDANKTSYLIILLHSNDLYDVIEE